MNRLRTWGALFFCWMFVLYNIERLYEPINLASFVYVLAAVAALPIMLVPALHRIPLAWLLLACVPPLLALKSWLGYPLGGAHFPLTVTEIAATWATLALARQTGQSLEDLRTAAVSALLTHLQDRTRPFEQGQAEIYRDIRRARRFERPLAVLAVSPSPTSVNTSLDRFTLELQHECARKYVFARVAELLSREMKDCNILSHDNTHFVTVLPEANRATALATAERLQRIAQTQLGIQLQVGVSVFPDEEVTFVRLVERAEAGLNVPSTPVAAPQAAATTHDDLERGRELHELLKDAEAL